MTQVPTIVRALALGGWLMGPVPPRLALAGVTKLQFLVTAKPPDLDYDLITAETRTGPFDAHIRVGRSELAPWCQFVGDLPGQEGPRETLAEAISRLEDYLTGETSPTIEKEKT